MNRLNNYLKIAILHPFLLIFYIVLKGIITLEFSIPNWTELFCILGFSLIFTLFLLYIGRFLRQNRINWSIVITLWIGFFLLALPIHETLNTISYALFPRMRITFMFCTFICMSVTFFLLWFKKAQSSRTFNHYLNLLFILLITTDLISYLSIKNNNTSLKDSELTININNNLPAYNIYLLVPDGYASPQNLMKYWSYDNREFTQYLKNKGFFISENTHSDYFYTIQTMSSCLNLTYNAPFAKEDYLEKKIMENQVTSLLSKNEYDCFTYDYNEYFYKTPENNYKILRMYFKQTVFSWLLEYKNRSFQNDYSLANTAVHRSAFDIFQQIAQQNDRKKFMYVHSMLTHVPFSQSVFSTPSGLFWQSYPVHSSNVTVKDAYLSSLKETNTLMQGALDRVWDKISQNSIIIIMSDHGCRLLEESKNNNNEEYYANFCAIYYPDKNYTALNDTLTPINVMRKVLNKAIGTNLKHIENKNIYR